MANDSLVVWVEKVHPQLGQRAFQDADQFDAVFPDQGDIRGQLHLYSSGLIAAVEFRAFARAQTFVPLQVHDGTNVIEFTVKNPAPAKAVSWSAPPLPLPQTNRTSHLLVTLSAGVNRAPNSNRRFYPSAFAPEGQQVGWLQWDLEGFDEVGNWARVDWVRPPRGVVDLPLPGEQDRAWKLVAKGTEYLSAGCLPQPMTNAFHICPLDARARALGVRLVAYVEPGSYLIADDSVRLVAGPPADIPSPVLEAESSGGKYSFRISTPEPALVWAVESGHYPSILTRLRERDHDNRGLIFPFRRFSLVSGLETPLVCAGFFDVDPLKRLGVATNKVEVEIIATHPGVEFFIKPPGL